MSYALNVWEHPPHFPMPTKLDEVAKAMLALQQVDAGINPKFEALAHKLVEQFPVEDEESGWLSSPVNIAKQVKRAVWNVEMPAGDARVRVMVAVVEQAKALGLTVFDDQLAMAFLPSGQVLPGEKAGMWALLQDELLVMPKAMTKAEARKKMAGLVAEALKPHGFKPKKLTRCDAGFARDIDNGFQFVKMSIRGDSPYLRCNLYCGVRREAVQEILEAVYGVNMSTEHTLGVSVDEFADGGGGGSGLPIMSDSEQKTNVSLLLSRGIPVLDMMRDLESMVKFFKTLDMMPFGVTVLHPSDPKTLSEQYYRGLSVLSGIVIAWLLSDEFFPEIVARAKCNFEKNVYFRDELDKLLSYLSIHTPPLDVIS